MTYQVACLESDLEPADVMQVTLNGVDLAIARDSDGSWHAIDDLCTHGNVSLSDGDVEDGGIECWKHGSVFDLKTGRPRQLPAIHPVAVYPTKLESGSVWVDVDSPIH
ncbi:non-heme iron oxygenase ferredoxin subunit [Flaviflexus equikiangi]|uniref:Non-heme iron oxygenase ferredoxin subunit n=1 Tax=Flaviflexus equikiangi TaxID=2758573 RepID=A0ABS2TGW0_9ACTO|nr:non-heme iron oxygenase ferredoxin subunit [Flaviflexus equikiangi]MBM9433348.1 non-heme iron oxygenase ferredoxin subunit [Flaviflexus equikiangi]